MIGNTPKALKLSTTHQRVLLLQEIGLPEDEFHSPYSYPLPIIIDLKNSVDILTQLFIIQSIYQRNFYIYQAETAGQP
jgi:hypothetical protein